jgi:H+/Cl- antiporter ClcA
MKSLIAMGVWRAVYLIVGLGAGLSGVTIMLYALFQWQFHNEPLSIGMLVVGLIGCFTGFAALRVDKGEFDTPAESKDD